MATAWVGNPHGLLPAVPPSLGMATQHPWVLHSRPDPSRSSVLDPAVPKGTGCSPLPGVKGKVCWRLVPPLSCSFLGNRLENAATESCLRKCLGPLIFLRVNLKRNPGKFCTSVCYTCRCFSSTGEQPLAPGPGSTGQGDSHGSPGCRLRYRKQQSNVQVLGCARHCFVVSLSCCRVCSAPAPAAVPIQRAKHSRAPSQPRGAERGGPPSIPAWEGFCPSVCRALLAEADSAAPGEHSKSLNMFAPSLFFLQTSLAGRTVPRFIPQAKRKQRQEMIAKCVQQLEVSLWLQGKASSAAPLLNTHPARPAVGALWADLIALIRSHSRYAAGSGA